MTKNININKNISFQILFKGVKSNMTSNFDPKRPSGASPSDEINQEQQHPYRIQKQVQQPKPSIAQLQDKDGQTAKRDDASKGAGEDAEDKKQPDHRREDFKFKVKPNYNVSKTNSDGQTVKYKGHEDILKKPKNYPIYHQYSKTDKLQKAFIKLQKQEKQQAIDKQESRNYSTYKDSHLENSIKSPYVPRHAPKLMTDASQYSLIPEELMEAVKLGSEEANEVVRYIKMTTLINNPLIRKKAESLNTQMKLKKEQMISNKELVESSSKFVSNTHVNYLQNSQLQNADSRERLFQSLKPSHLIIDELKDLDLIHRNPEDNNSTHEHPSFMLSPSKPGQDEIYIATNTPATLEGMPSIQRNYQFQTGSGIGNLISNPIKQSINDRDLRNRKEYLQVLKISTRNRNKSSKRIESMPAREPSRISIAEEDPKVNNMLQRDAKNSQSQDVNQFYLPKISAAPTDGHSKLLEHGQTPINESRIQNKDHESGSPQEEVRHKNYGSSRNSNPGVFNAYSRSIGQSEKSYGAMSKNMLFLIKDRPMQEKANLHKRMEAIRREEMRNYQHRIQIDISKKRSKQLGLPGPERMRTKLFPKNIVHIPDLATTNEPNYKHYLMTRDRFPEVEEYSHIERKRRIEAGEPLTPSVQDSVHADFYSNGSVQRIQKKYPLQVDTYLIRESTNEQNNTYQTRKDVNSHSNRSNVIKSFSKDNNSPLLSNRKQGEKQVTSVNQSQKLRSREALSDEKVPYYDKNHQVGLDDIVQFKDQKNDVRRSLNQLPTSQRGSDRQTTQRGSRPKGVGMKSVHNSMEGLIANNSNQSLLEGISETAGTYTIGPSVDMAQFYVNLKFIIQLERCLANIKKCLFKPSSPRKLIRSVSPRQKNKFNFEDGILEEQEEEVAIYPMQSTIPEIEEKTPKTLLECLTEFDQLLTETKNDYCNYLRTKDNKVTNNATKLLIFCSCLFQLLSTYTPPIPKPEIGQKQDFEIERKVKRYLDNQELFRIQMLNITRYLYESHAILCKLILTKLKSRNIEVENQWIRRLERIVHINFDEHSNVREHSGKNIYKQAVHKHFVSTQAPTDFKSFETPNYDEVIATIFKNSRVPLFVVKQNNVMVLSILKKLLTTKFQKQGVFETLWLTVLYWNKVTVKSLRQFLKIEDEKSNLVEIEVNDKNIQNAGEFSDDALDGKQENMMKLKEFLGVRPTIDLKDENQLDQHVLGYANYNNPAYRITRHAQNNNKVFNMDETSSGLNKKMKDTHQEAVLDHQQAVKIFGKINPIQVAPPFLPPKLPDDSEYTLVLDLDETLIHFFEDGEESYFLVRPFAKEFLNEMSKYYEIVVFTAAVQEYADWVIDHLDPDCKIKHRLYREHTYISPEERVELMRTIRHGIIRHETMRNDGTMMGKSGSGVPLILKDLAKIGRPLEKSIIVDNLADNFFLQKQNGIFISTWLDNPYDTELKQLIPLLKQIVILGVQDVRKSLKAFRDQTNRMIFEGNPEFVGELKEDLIRKAGEEDEPGSKNASPKKKAAGSPKSATGKNEASPKAGQAAKNSLNKGGKETPSIATPTPKKGLTSSLAPQKQPSSSAQKQPSPSGKSPAAVQKTSSKNDPAMKSPQATARKTTVPAKVATPAKTTVQKGKAAAVKQASPTAVKGKK